MGRAPEGVRPTAYAGTEVAMATTVFTGWRKVTPGRCSDCGEKDGWDCDGRGTVFCDCQVCAQCGEFDGHGRDCPEPHVDPDGTYGEAEATDG